MLDQVDTLIAFALLMLLLSLLIMTLVQTATVLFQRRGRHLLWGVAQILKQMGVDAESAEIIAKAVLFHPAISPSQRVLALAIRPEELMRLLMEVLARPKLLSPEAQAEPWFNELRSASAATVADIRAWFDMIMDRTTESFVAWTRSITVALSCALCVVFQVDALDMLHQLSTDKELRAKIVAQVEPTLRQAEESLASTKGVNALGTEAISRVRQKLGASPQTAADAKLIENVPNDLDTNKKGREWLKQAVRDPEKQKAMIGQYDAEFQVLARKRFEELSASGSELADRLGDTQLSLIHDPFDFSRYKDWHHPAGIMMAALLLSLGAPFWFNTLRNLSNLRPILASRVEPERGK